MPLSSKIANALKSATTVVNVSRATAPSADQILTATSATAATWQAAGGATRTVYSVSTTFEATGRFSLAVTSAGTNTFGATGLAQETSATGTSGTRGLWLHITAGESVGGSPLWSTHFEITLLGSDVNTFCGMGLVGNTGGTISYTFGHYGFKVTRAASGTASLFGTQADGTTETATSALRTVIETDALDVIVKVNGTTSADYYSRINSGALSAATNLTATIPAATIDGRSAFSISNVATATNSIFIYYGASYER